MRSERPFRPVRRCTNDPRRGAQPASTQEMRFEVAEGAMHCRPACRTMSWSHPPRQRTRPPHLFSAARRAAQQQLVLCVGGPELGPDRGRCPSSGGDRLEQSDSLECSPLALPHPGFAIPAEDVACRGHTSSRGVGSKEVIIKTGQTLVADSGVQLAVGHGHPAPPTVPATQHRQ